MICEHCNGCGSLALSGRLPPQAKKEKLLTGSSCKLFVPGRDGSELPELALVLIGEISSVPARIAPPRTRLNLVAMALLAPLLFPLGILASRKGAGSIHAYSCRGVSFFKIEPMSRS
jgi:hypothetical protein